MQDQLKTVTRLSNQWISSRFPLQNQKNMNENMHTVDKIVKFVNKVVIIIQYAKPVQPEFRTITKKLASSNLLASFHQFLRQS
ncbi:hypothetical protein CN514_15370 [Bacillus sp. AFS001701]|nr:hypothetical protein CN514_15370 [Bacillus sp. AFS001701]